jgi:hypothetical protein
MHQAQHPDAVVAIKERFFSPTPTQEAATPPPTAADCDHLRTQVTAQQMDEVEQGIQALQKLFDITDVKELVRLWKSHKADWHKWNSTRYERETREKHQVEHYVFMQAVERELTRRKEDLPTLLGKGFKRGLKPVEGAA